MAEQTAVRIALDHINSNRGRGNVVRVEQWRADGTGEAKRRTFSGRESFFQFRTEYRPGSVRVFALGTSRVEAINPIE